MSSSPAGVRDGKKLSRYGESWGSLMRSVRGGTSWSGSELNGCFVNISGKRFANASAMSGLDFPDDGRAMAVCDWNRDGKLDLWLRNRSAPRLRLMCNQGAMGNSMALRLQGVKCNRDAVGAVVEMKAGGRLLMRSVRAGEMFLSQSSKWLHFGLGKNEKVDEVIVSWPGGAKEKFRGLKSGGRFLLRQGEGVARAVMEPAGFVMEVKGGEDLARNGSRATAVKSIRLPVALPLPTIPYRDDAMKPQRLNATGRLRLLVVWESSCERCAGDLRELEARRKKLAAAGIEVLALAADEEKNARAVSGKIDDTGFSGSWGFADAGSLRSLWKWQAAWFDRRSSPSVPFGCLIDGRGSCLALYRSGLDVETIIRDARELVGIDPRTRWHLAPPLNGTWFTNPLDARLVWRSIGLQMRARDPQ